jgi:hypothetical protein
LSKVRREASRHFRNKKRQHLKDKINELESNSKNRNIRDLYSGINESKKGYQPRNNLAKDERGDLIPDPHKILNRWKNYSPHFTRKSLRGDGGSGAVRRESLLAGGLKGCYCWKTVWRTRELHYCIQTENI